ncbi:hypothetical protein B0H16DRAFT_1888786 [Mycena metata]|uniref:Uncharacterized protein n=1 Tax=Mycena metata TaxID=1033252 RepID=A0AAD7IR77_9AGAR|nr:hypothetical protein B0H16DRAFT_1888786 [Mycena metata]
MAAAVEKMVYQRFGCELPLVKVVCTLQLPGDMVIAKVLGDKDVARLSEVKWHNLAVFLAQCKNLENDLSSITPTLLDFHRSSSRIHHSWAMNVGAFKVDTVPADGNPVYLVQETINPGPLFIVLKSARTALEIIRQNWGPRVADVAKQLVARRMPFHLCIRRPRSLFFPPAPSAGPAPSMAQTYTGLGYRSANFKAGRWHYDSYRTLRNRLLLTPRGQVALRSGGLIARIASEVVSFDDTFPDVVPDQGICFCPRHGSVAFWANELTEDEVDIICGVYFVATTPGQRDVNKANDTPITIRSWWPRPSAFIGSSLNVGWWSPACESFYQGRMQRFADGTADLISSVEWKKNLKLERKCIPYIEGVEKCSALILASTASQLYC